MSKRLDITFCQAVCERYQCTEENYPLVVWRLCLPRRKWWVARLLLVARPKLFADDFVLIRGVSMDTQPHHIATEVATFRREYYPKGFLRRDLKLRLSTRALVKLGWELLSDVRQPATSDTETDLFHKPAATSSNRVVAKI